MEPPDYLIFKFKESFESLSILEREKKAEDKHGGKREHLECSQWNNE